MGWKLPLRTCEVNRMARSIIRRREQPFNINAVGRLCVWKTMYPNVYEFLTFLLNWGQIPLRYLVADRSEAGRRPAASWNLAYHLARYSSELARASRYATGLRPASDLPATRIA